MKSYRSDCPSCGCGDTRLFYEKKRVPVNSVLNVLSRSEAHNFPTGDISLGFCRYCGFIYNTLFEPDKVRYSAKCEESQGYSTTFNAFAIELADRLIEKYSLRRKRIIEIGCGKGEFLKMICKRGDNRGVGFDPAYVPGRGEVGTFDGVEFIADYFSEKYAHYQGDMVCCRMTLEHIFEPSQIVQIVRHSIGNRLNTVVFFQVPDVTRILNDCAFEDIYYEHCSYFSPGSLARLFRSHKFDLLDLSTAYEGQYLLIEARPAANNAPNNCLELEDDLTFLAKSVSEFRTRMPQSKKYWRDLLASFENQNQRTVIWGSGSKGVAFLNTVTNSNKIEYVVDINPYRQGTYMAGTGQEIVAPEFLKQYRPDAVIVMNAVYTDEIRRKLAELGQAPAIHFIGEQVKKNQ